MSVSCGIVGLPNVGKSTIFNALTAAQAEQGNYPFCTIEPNVATVEVPDPALARIHTHIRTDRVLPAICQVTDIAGLIAGAASGEGMGNKFLGSIRECDAIMQVVRCFEGSSVLRDDPVDPIGDIEVIELELVLADLDTVQKAIERNKKKMRSQDKEALAAEEAYLRAEALLEAGTLLRTESWTEREMLHLKPLCLMTSKSMLYVANVADDDLLGEGELAQRVAAYAGRVSAAFVPFCGDLESELRKLDDDDRDEFMAELGVTELGLSRLISEVYRVLGLRTYYTAGEKEIRAWTIRAGDRAPVAAGVIHTDFEKGFIRAEVYSVDDLDEHRSEGAIRAAGRLRTEGRDYVMQEGDVCHFLVGN
jgi:GTP-binding protein YchF